MTDAAEPGTTDAAVAWRAFTAELDRWAAAGRTATFWWRDDDAADATPALGALLRRAEGRALALATIPAKATAALAAALAEAPPTVDVLPHGLAHANHAPAGEKKAEFGAHRALDTQRAEIGAGWARLQAIAGARARPVFVPPWNRIDPALADRVGEAGLAAVSLYGPRRPGSAGRVLNTHVDIIDWRGTRGFVGEPAALAAATRHLAARRTAGEGVDPTEPTGLLTHHLDHDADCWAFIDAFLAATEAHPAAALVPAARDYEAPAAPATAEGAGR